MINPTLITGPMFAGKTTAAINFMEDQFSNNLFFKPSIDNRYGTSHITTHDGVRRDCKLISNLTDCDSYFLKNKVADSILIDEVQFLGDFIIPVIKEASNLYKVYITGLNFWANGSPPDIIKELLKWDNLHHIELYSRCDECNKEARYTFKKKESPSLVEIGSSDIYCTKCLYHFRKARREQKLRGVFI